MNEREKKIFKEFIYPLGLAQFKNEDALIALMEQGMKIRWILHTKCSRAAELIATGCCASTPCPSN